MTKRTKEAYVAMLRFVEENIGRLNPISFMSDFETALRNAVRLVYKCRTQGCYFHYTQAVRKNASQIPRFFTTINQNSAMSQVYHKFLALPLLPKERVMEGYDCCTLAAAEFGDTFTRFVQYFHRQWIVKVRNKLIILKQLYHNFFFILI